MAASFRFAVRLSVSSTGVTVLSCTEMRNVPTCISYSVSVVEILALLYRNTRDDNDVSVCGRAIFFKQLSSELGSYILQQMMFLKQIS